MKDYASYTPINDDYSFGTEDRAYYLGNIYQFTPSARYSIYENIKKGDYPNGNRLFDT